MRSLIRFAPGAALLLATAFAQPRAGMRNMPMYDPATETTLTGTVDSVQQFPGACCRGYQSGTHVTVKTDAGPTEVHLGPTTFLTKHELSFAKGDKIEVTGSKVKSGDTSFVIAREVKKGDKTVTLRDKAGKPEWSGGPGRPGGPPMQ